MMLGKSSVVDRIMVHPKLLAMWEFSTGQGFRAGTVAGTILPQSEANGEFLGVPLHADQAWLPQPWPEHNCVATICLPCDGMTEEEGATVCVPGSHLHRRLWSPAEGGAAEGVPLVVREGCIWGGSTWHATGVRTLQATHPFACELSAPLHAACRGLYASAARRGVHGGCARGDRWSPRC